MPTSRFAAPPKGSYAPVNGGDNGGHPSPASNSTPYLNAMSASSVQSLAPRDVERYANHSSFAEKYSLSPSPAAWGTPLLMSVSEPDDALHNPDPARDAVNDRGGTIFSMRGLANLGCLAVLGTGLLTLFAGYPLITQLTKKEQSTQGGFNLGGTNATGQVPTFIGNWGLVDKDTPVEAYSKRSYLHPDQDMVLVFSDEFEREGRTFYPGDDPFWEAVDLHYWGTNDLEWYDPKKATTGNGSLLITLGREDPLNNHNLSFSSAMIQTWNKFCFTGGILEASVMLPGANDISGLWPAVWSMGNLGRAGFGSSVEGMWPYSYDSCDVGTLPNQTYPGTNTPAAALTGGDPTADGELSYLPRQRLSACTCPGESHPGPMRSDGSYVGRSAPEIDVIEATIHNGRGAVSLSAQWGPYNAGYNWQNTSDTYTIYDTAGTTINEYKGGVYQQTTSGLALTNQSCYELEEQCFAVYAFEYRPGFDNAYVLWVNDAKPSWMIWQTAMGADPLTEIGSRPVPQEPMYIIANLGFSHNFGFIDLEAIQFPTTMRIDYIRVYQPVDAVNIGCDPISFPTAAYINTYRESYSYPNMTLWSDYQPWPKNRLLEGCD